MRGSPVLKTPQKTAPPQMLRLPRIFLFFNTTREPQWVPSENFHLLSLQKTRSESPGAAPPQNFPFFKHYAPPQKRSESPVFINPLTTGVENECWLRGMVHLDYNLPNVIWLGFGKVESYLIHTISEKAKNDKSKVRTRADRLWPSTVLPPMPDERAHYKRLTFILTVRKLNVWVFM